MGDISNKQRRGFISYLDEKDNKIEGYFDILHFDSSVIKFRTAGNVITLPTSRLLKLKEKEEFDKSGESGTIN